jgi:hypothetical protein
VDDEYIEASYLLPLAFGFGLWEFLIHQYGSP